MEALFGPIALRLQLETLDRLYHATGSIWAASSRGRFIFTVLPDIYLVVDTQTQDGGWRLRLSMSGPGGIVAGVVLASTDSDDLEEVLAQGLTDLRACIPSFLVKGQRTVSANEAELQLLKVKAEADARKEKREDCPAHQAEEKVCGHKWQVTGGQPGSFDVRCEVCGEMDVDGCRC